MKQVRSCYSISSLPALCSRNVPRTLWITLLLVFFCLEGCSGDDHHNFQRPGKIPIDAKRWYQLNNASFGLDQLFNNKQFENPNTGYGMLLENYEAWYPLREGEQMTIDSIMMFDWEGTCEDHPMTIYAVTADWKRIPIAVFTGMRYDAWNGPDPKTPDIYTVKNTIAGIRYLVINSWGDFPGEIEFYGSYTPPQARQPITKKYLPLKNYFGVNAFEWDFEDPSDPQRLDPVKLPALGSFTGIRHYMDWDKIEPEEGIFTFNPTQNGGWNYDTIYQWCRNNGIEVLACLKAVPPWMLATYPEDQKDDENIPMRYGRDPADPASYTEQAKAGFQFAARYGSNKTIPSDLIKIAPGNEHRSGLGTIRYIECDNERNKWWKGRKSYQTGREYAANLSAFYDGHKNKLGPGTGIKNADPGMLVVMGGLASPDAGYVRGMIDWCKQYRGYRPDGSIDLPWDVINYHYYCNDEDYIPGRKQTTGMAPELTNASVVADQFLQVAHEAGDMPVWITEAGYDIDQRSPQKALIVSGKTGAEIQAAWLLRTSLLYARSGIQKVFYYELMDDNPKTGGRFASSGLINGDRTNRAVANYFSQVSHLFGDFAFSGSVCRYPLVDKYTFNSKAMFMLVVPDQQGKTEDYTLDLKGSDSAYIYSLQPNTSQMSSVVAKTNHGKIQVKVSETPVFVTAAAYK